MIDKILQEIEQHGLIVCPDFFSKKEISGMSAFFDQHRSEFTPAMVGKGQDKKRVESIRGDFTFWIDPIGAPEVFSPIIRFLKDLQERLNQSFFLGLKEFECHLAFYPPGTSYQKHLDRFSQDSSRSFTFIFYLNESWSDSDRGELVIYNKKGEPITTVLPKPGTFVGFLSEEFPHEVCMAQKERRSFTGWMHTKIIH